MYENISTEIKEGVGWIIINRPDKLNALNTKTIEELQNAFQAFQDNPEVKVVILTGAGEKAFVAGADIGELSALDTPGGEAYSKKGQMLTQLIENFPKAVIGSINGYALGGGTELAMACHIRIASENAKMGQPEVKLGLIPGFGGTQRLGRLVGKGKALELILSGRTIDAHEAHAIGLVNRVVPLTELAGTCEKLAREIMVNSPLAVQYAIEVVNKGLDMSLEEGLKLEEKVFGQTCSSEDGKEGTKAFLEKRKANFRGK